jgi:hypothetical protein
MIPIPVAPMTLRRSAPLALFALASACAPSMPRTADAVPAQASVADTMTTAPERTGFRETSRYAEVVAFMEGVDRVSPVIRVIPFGETAEGRTLPLAVVGRLPDPSPAAVRRSGKTVVYLQGNIHAGEVEGKESLQILLREIAAGRHAALLDSLVLLVAPHLQRSLTFSSFPFYPLPTPLRGASIGSGAGSAEHPVPALTNTLLRLRYYHSDQRNDM